jgi:hypothetical protein
MAYVIVHGEQNANEAKAVLVPFPHVQLVVANNSNFKLEWYIPAPAGAEVFLVGIRPALSAQFVGAGCNIVGAAATTAEARAAILRWLRPPGAQRPSDAFVGAAGAVPNLLLARDALTNADEIDPSLYGFPSAVARGLGEYARAGRVGGNQDVHWRGLGLDHATSGATIFVVEALANGTLVKRQRSLLHFRQGGRGVHPTLAPRVYYATFTVTDKFFVAVSYCGPHPKDGSHTVAVDLPL